MKRISLLLVAACSLACTLPGAAATRPRYGGTLRMETRGALSSFDPVPQDSDAGRSSLRNRLLEAVCDGLVALDASGTPRPALAINWRSEREGRSWYFTLRTGVALHNGSMLGPQIVVAALAAANPSWHVRATEREILIQSDAPVLDMLAQLAMSKNSIYLRGNTGQWIGSGPFYIADSQPGKHVQLRAFDDCWRGRPFLDRIEIQTGMALTEQSADLELGRADIVDADPAQQKPANATAPLDLIALMFTSGRPAVQDARIREAIALSLDRNAIVSVILRKQGEASASLLPEWISGYAHLFNTAQDLTQARQVRSLVGNAPPLSLAYDAADPVAKLIAERVAVNTREVNILVQPYPEAFASRTPNADMMLVRVRIASPDPAAALGSVGETLALASLEKASATTAADALYKLESDALKDYAVVPIAHATEAFTSAPTVHDWTMTPWGSLRLEELWIEAAQ
jgi:MarR-like DNA-binding transcriptional regulator SgrR of sgrS sRNA